MRTVLSEPGQLCPPIWSCTSRGLPCPRCCHRGGGLLPHLFTLTRDANREDVPKVFLRAITGLLRRRYILCGTVRDACRCRVLTRPAAYVPWRYQARCPSCSCRCRALARHFHSRSGVRTFLPPTLRPPSGGLRASQRSSGSPASPIIRRILLVSPSLRKRQRD